MLTCHEKTVEFSITLSIVLNINNSHGTSIGKATSSAKVLDMIIKGYVLYLSITWSTRVE